MSNVSGARITLSEAQLVRCPKSTVDEFDRTFREFLHGAVDDDSSTWSWSTDPEHRSHTFTVWGSTSAVEKVKHAAMAVVHGGERKQPRQPTEVD